MLKKTFHLSTGGSTTIESPRRFVVSNFGPLIPYSVLNDLIPGLGIPLDTKMGVSVTIDMLGEAHSVTVRIGNAAEAFSPGWDVALRILARVSLHIGPTAGK